MGNSDSKEKEKRIDKKLEQLTTRMEKCERDCTRLDNEIRICNDSIKANLKITDNLVKVTKDNSHDLTKINGILRMFVHAQETSRTHNEEVWQRHNNNRYGNPPRGNRMEVAARN